MDELKEKIIQALEEHDGEVIKSHDFWKEKTNEDNMATINEAFKELEALGIVTYYREGTGNPIAKLTDNEE